MGHAYAGGLITVLDCDLRIATAGDLQFALNDPIGIPMRTVYCEIIKYAVGTSSASDMTRFGQVNDLAAAQRMGVVSRIVPPERLIEEAVCLGRRSRAWMPSSCLRVHQTRIAGRYAAGNR